MDPGAGVYCPGSIVENSLLELLKMDCLQSYHFAHLGNN